MNRWALVLCIAILAGCGASPPPDPAETGGPLSVVAEPQLAEGVVSMERACEEGTVERCDGTDSNCDGQIDEGCEGAVSADIVLALAWNDSANLSLSIEGPSTFERAEARGSCDDTHGSGRLERRWTTQAQEGRYVVRVQRVDACESEEPTTVSLALSVLGDDAGSFNRTLVDDTTVELIAFELSR